MKKVICIILAFSLLLPIATGCSMQEPQRNEPELSQIRAICELATLKCYFHNVAKATKNGGSGFFLWAEYDRTFWIQYTGIATIGVDLSKVQMTINGDEVSITIPPAKLLNIYVDENDLSDDTFIASDDNSWNNNEITAEDQVQAIKSAQDTMKEEVISNASLLQNAQTRAMELIENYITQLGKSCGVEYHIKWVQLLESGDSANVTQGEETVS